MHGDVACVVRVSALQFLLGGVSLCGSDTT
jgi:hypothetical protein